MLRFWFAVCLILCVVPGPARASGKMLSGPVRAEVLDVIDGDTLEVRIEVWLGQAITTRLRLNGIDTPEMKSRCPGEQALALKAKAELHRLTRNGPVILTNIHHGKYAGRVIATVATPDGLDVGTYMIEKGLARAYRGRARMAWC